MVDVSAVLGGGLGGRCLGWCFELVWLWVWFVELSALRVG